MDPNTQTAEPQEAIEKDIVEVLEKNVELASVLSAGETFVTEIGTENLTIAELKNLESLSDRITDTSIGTSIPLFAYLQKDPDGTEKFGIFRKSKTLGQNQAIISVTKTSEQEAADIKSLRPFQSIDDNPVDFSGILGKVGEQLSSAMIKEAREQNLPNKFLIPGRKQTPDNSWERSMRSLILKDIPLDRSFDILSVSSDFKSPEEYIAFMKKLIGVCRTYSESPLFLTALSAKDPKALLKDTKITFKFPMNEKGAEMKRKFAEWLENRLPLIR